MSSPTDDEVFEPARSEEDIELSNLQWQIVQSQDCLARQMAKARQLQLNSVKAEKAKISRLETLIKQNSRKLDRNAKCLDKARQTSTTHAKTTNAGTQTWPNTLDTVTQQMARYEKGSTIQKLWDEMLREKSTTIKPEDRTDTIIRDMRVSQMPNADAATYGHLVGCSVTIANATKLSKIDREIAAINDKLDALLSLLKK